MLCFVSWAREGSAANPGEPGPDFTLTELGSGQLLALSELKGQIVYLDFWASWCGPCRKSLPLYEVMQTELPAGPFQIVAINLDENPEDARRFLEQHPVSYTILLDPEGNTAKQWQIKAMPSSFLLDRNGRIVHSWAGFEPSHIEDIRNEISLLLD